MEIAHRSKFPALLESVLLIVFIVLAYYFEVVIGKDAIYTHFAYIPIILAAFWWGQRAVWIALAFSVVILVFHLAGIGFKDLLLEIIRISFFFLIAFFTGTLRDRLKASQEALVRSQESYRQLIDKSIAGILVYRNTKILFVNRRSLEILGYRGEHIIGRSIWDFIYKADRPKVEALVAKREKGDLKDLQYECRLVRSNGDLIWADMASSPIRYEGEEAVIVNLYNITQAKEAEAKRRELAEVAQKQEEQLIHSTRLAELGEMAAAIAHELNQPLTGIMNFAKNATYMIENNAGSMEEVNGNLRLISEQVSRASKIINQMRELTRKTDKQFIPLDINQILRESVDFLKPQLRLFGVEVTLHLSEEIPEVLGDRIRLEQVFLNLLANAKQAMEESPERRLTVRSRFLRDQERPVAIEIEDTGKGFTPEIYRKLFTPFFTTKKVGHGTGLGLSISLNIVKDHKGSIEARGEPGQGAVFTIRLPLHH